MFQSEAEQIQKIDAAAENAAREAESEKPSAFVISEDEIDRMLRAGSNFEGGKIRIYALYQQQEDAKERAAFLKENTVLAVTAIPLWMAVVVLQIMTGKAFCFAIMAMIGKCDSHGRRWISG